jgi:glycine betaine/proline transport system permease protein
MIELPIGENFESFVDWLKDSFSGFFDFISDVLDFSITVLENTLLLNSQTLYASVIFGLLFALVAGFVARRFLGRKGFIPVVLATLILFGFAETLRLGQLSSEITEGEAATMLTDFQNLQDGLSTLAPEDFEQPRQALQLVAQALPADLVRDTPAYKVDDVIDDSLRDIRRARSGDYEDVYEALDASLETIQAEAYVIEPEHLQAIETERARYKTFMLIEESADLVDDFQELVADQEVVLKSEFINQRSYDGLIALLDHSIQFYAERDSHLSEVAAQAEAHLRSLNPKQLAWYPPLATMWLLAMIAGLIAGRGIVVFTILGMLVIRSMGMWIPTVESLALVLSATLFALTIGVPMGVGAARSPMVDRCTRPILDFMQTMPAFVYLIPAVIFFGLGKVPGAMATLIFAMPPAVRLTSLGIRQVPSEVVEAAQAFGATNRQLLIKAQLPIAMPTILAGVNQTIMLALSMVVIGGMIGAGGLGKVVLSGITQMKLGLGFEGGIAVVILAIYLDRVTQALGAPKSQKNRK